MGGSRGFECVTCAVVCVQVKCAAEASHGKYDDAPTMMALYLGFVGLPKKLGPLDQMRVYTCNMVGTGTRARRENTENRHQATRAIMALRHSIMKVIGV